MTVYLTVDEITYLHDRLITTTGGMPGIRDKAILAQATTAVRLEQAGWDRFNDDPSKAAKIFHAIASEKPFVDGNKRAAFLAGAMFLKRNGLDLEPGPEEVVKVCRAVEEGRAAAEVVAAWMRDRTRSPQKI